MENQFFDKNINNHKNLVSISSLADKYNLRGLKYFDQNDFESAITCFFQALNYDSNYAHAYSNIGNILLQKGDYDEAVNMYKNAIDLDSSNNLYHFNLGVALTQLEDTKGAADAYKESLKLKPKDVKTIRLLGNCYKHLKLYSKASELYRKWSKLDPSSPMPLFLQAENHIRHGRFNIGWKLYEYGLKDNIRKPIDGYYNEKKILWDGKSFDGTLLVYGEQGIGDQINFGTLLTELLQVQRKVCLKVDKRLVSIFATTFPTIKVFAKEDQIPAETYDKFIAIGSLNKFFRNHTNDFINSKFNKYEVIIEKEVERIFAHISGFKIGISWHSFSDKTGKRRSLKTEDLAKIISVNNINFINIQYGNVSNQVKKIKLMSGKEILKIPFVDLTHNISSVANIINNCDLIISVDNTTAHLAASLGKPVWLLLPYNADFRWMEDITMSLWYKNVTLIRQSNKGSWSYEVDMIYNSLNESNINSQ